MILQKLNTLTDTCEVQIIYLILHQNLFKLCLFKCILMPLGFQIYCVINNRRDMGRKVNMALQSPPNTVCSENQNKRQQIDLTEQQNSFLHP